MSRNLLDPVILDTIVYQPIEKIPTFDWSQILNKFKLSNILSFLIPLVIFLFIAIIIKLKWDNKQNGTYMKI